MASLEGFGPFKAEQHTGKPLCCAFTGHRPNKFPWKYNERDMRCIILKRQLVALIRELIDQGVTEFLSGMAEGTDQWAALFVLALREENPALRLRCILPCKTQADGWNDASRAQYERILQQANEVSCVSETFTSRCMMERNRALVEQSSILLAVCRNVQEPRGGTAATVRYAQKLGRQILLLDPVTGQVHRENAAL